MRLALLAFLAFVATNAWAAQSECSVNDTAIYQTLVASYIGKVTSGRDMEYRVFISPAAAQVSSEGIHDLLARYRVRERFAPIPSDFESRPEYAAMLLGAQRATDLPNVPGAHISMGGRTEKELCDNSYGEIRYEARLEFSGIGYGQNCATAAVYSRSQDCLSEGHYIHFLMRDATWKVQSEFILYELGD